MINFIDIFTHYFYLLLSCIPFISLKILKMKQQIYQSHDQVLWFIILCLAQNNFHAEKTVKHIKRLMRYRVNVTITVGFISLISCVAYYFVFMLSFFTTQQYRNKDIVVIFLYQGQRPSWLLLVKLVYSWKYTVTLLTNFSLGTVAIPSLNDC